MYVYKKPVEQELWGVSLKLCPRLTVVQVQCCASWGCATLSSIHVQVCSGSDVFSAELWARACERERDSHVSAFSWGRLRFALRLLGTDSSAAPNGRCGPEPLASKGEMMARLSTGIKVPQQTLPAIKSRKGDAHASPERENSNLRVKLHWKVEQKCRRAKESSGADFVYMHSTLYLNYTYCCSQCGNFAARGNTSV